jgi:hypothetical protein
MFRFVQDTQSPWLPKVGSVKPAHPDKGGHSGESQGSSFVGATPVATHDDQAPVRRPNRILRIARPLVIGQVYEDLAWVSDMCPQTYSDARL